MGWLGFISNDESEAADVVGREHPLLAGAAIIHPAATTGGGVHSKGAWDYEILTGQDWLQAFTARASATGKVWYYFTVESITQSDDDMTRLHFRSNYDSGNSPITDGTVAVAVRKGDASDNFKDTKFRLRLYRYTSGWILLGTSGVFNKADGRLYLRLELDFTPGGAPPEANYDLSYAKEGETAMTSAISGGPTNLIKTAGATGTPCIYSEDLEGKSGDRIWKIRGEEVMVHDDSSDTPGPTTAQNYTDESDEYHCLTRYPVNDVTTEWAPTNPCAGQEHWSTVDDVEDDDDTADDYVSKVSALGTAYDELFDVGELEDSETNIECVYIAVRRDHNAGDVNKETIIAQIASESVVAYTDYVLGTTGRWMFKTLNKTPEGTPVAWTKTEFNTLRVGVRTPLKDGVTHKAYLIVVGVLGKSIQRPTAATCPAARRIFTT